MDPSSPLLELQAGGWSPDSQAHAESCEAGPWSLTLHEGESLLIEGPSGVGKSLLLHRLAQSPLAGLYPTGRLLWHGFPAPQQGEALRSWWAHEVRLVPQDVQSALSPCLTLGEQLHLAFCRSPLQRQGLGLAELLRRLDLDAAQLSPLFPSQASGGQRQRIGLVMGLLAAPKLLLLDEPSSALHAELAARLPALLRSVIPATSCVWTTHDPVLRDALAQHQVRSLELRPRFGCSPEAPATPERIPEESPPSSLHAKIGRCLARVTDLSIPIGPDRELRVPDGAVPAGQIVGWWGPSGVGKTSLARCLAGLLRPRSGSSEVLAAATPDSLSCFLAFQNAFACFVPHLTIRHQLVEALKASNRWSLVGLADLHTLFEDLDLPSRLLESLPGECSGGQLQRCALARALVVRPQLLILDEPTSALDASNRARVARVLRHFVADGQRSVCIISHDRPWLRNVADCVWDLQAMAHLASAPFHEPGQSASRLP